jgi:hypothetical protein
MSLVMTPALFAGDVTFDPTTTQEEFHDFSSVVSQGIFATPVEPARATSLLGFDIGVAATAVPIDEKAAYWVKSVSDSDLARSGYFLVPRLVASKGLGAATVSATYAKVPDSEIKMFGASVDVPIIKGTVATPTLAIRGTYSQLQGVDQFKLKNYGAEAFLCKGFGPLMPYVGAGMVRTDSEGRVEQNGALLYRLEDQFDSSRITVGLRISLLVPKIVIEATQGDERTYAAKISLGL